MKLGDFTGLAKAYINRPAYNTKILDAIIGYSNLNKESLKVADIGAGTGKLTKILLEMGLSVDAVEPNSDMFLEGMEFTKSFEVKWHQAPGERTGLQDSTYDWVIMASSFHWTDTNQSLPEFSRILKNNGSFTAIWNPRNIASSEFHTTIENKIYEIAPNIQRVSSGNKKHTKNWNEVIRSTGHFKDVIFMEMDHDEVMSIDRYLGAWRSVNDIRSQAGEKNWEKVFTMIENEVSGLNEISVPYKMRAWTGVAV